MSSVPGRTGALLAAGALVLLGSGCASAERPDVERVATSFEDPSGGPQARCDLLMPQTLEQLEEQLQTSCAEGIGDVTLQGGVVERVAVWGGDAQVQLSGDTLFLTNSRSGWRIAAAVCTPQPEGPYDCQVEG